MDMPIFQPDAATVEADAVMKLLDQVRRPAETNTGDPRCLDGNARARIFAAIDDPSIQTWRAARSIIVVPDAVAPTNTLWQMVVDVAPDAGDVYPTSVQIIAALSMAAQVAR